MTVETSSNNRNVSLGDLSADDIDEDEVEKRLRDMHFNNNNNNNNFPASVPKNHKVVRLSRWEGGNAFDQELFNIPAYAQYDEEEQNQGPNGDATVLPRQHSVTLRDVIKVFRRSDAFLEVKDEDIERVKIMHDRFMGDCRPSFNYNALLFIASVIAALGLGSNSVASIIASMLVSPLMGPVVGALL
jgi:hypothetical protein